MAGESEQIGQDEIEALLRQATQQAAAASPPPPRGETPPVSAEAPRAARQAPADQSPGSIAPGDIEFLLNQAQQALSSIDSPAPLSASDAKPFQLPEFASAAPNTEVATIDLLRDVELDVEIELGRTHMLLEDVLKLCKGAVVPLDKLAGDPVDIYVNGRLIARGEVLILNDNFCVRVAELIAGELPGAEG